ncbi:hypothetical protein [Photorhabdus australis]|nr:hypothetical protein [Photorhabdus australis]
MNNLVEIFCDVDDFCRFFIPQWTQFALITDTVYAADKAACIPVKA